MHTTMPNPLSRSLRGSACLLSLALLLNQFAVAATPTPQTPSESNSAPAPIQRASPTPPPLTDAPSAQITAARTVFITNSGADDNFPVNPNQAYNDVYKALKSWGHFQIVATPAQADLVLQLHAVAPITDVTGGRDGVYSLTSPAFQLVILDPKTNVALWTVTSPVYQQGNRKARAAWYALSLTNLVSRLKVLSGQPLTATETADLTTFPKSHLKRDLVFVGAFIAVAAVGGVLITHYTLQNMKNSQDAFCNAHGIPLNQCAGG